jgi:hypothetical protein
MGLLLAKPRGCPWHRPWFFADIALLFTCHTCMHLLLNFQHWRLAKNQGFSEGIPLCCMPAVVLGIFPGKFARGFKPLSKSLAKGHYSCSDTKPQSNCPKDTTTHQTPIAGRAPSQKREGSLLLLR